MIALAPLLVLWMGYGAPPKVDDLRADRLLPDGGHRARGLRATDPQLLLLMRSVGARRWDVFWRVRVPAALPYLAAGLRAGITLSLVGAVVAEWTGADRGLGYLVLSANARLATAQAFAAVLVITILGLLAYGVAVLWNAASAGGCPAPTVVRPPAPLPSRPPAERIALISTPASQQAPDLRRPLPALALPRCHGCSRRPGAGRLRRRRAGRGGQWCRLCRSPGAAPEVADVTLIMDWVPWVLDIPVDVAQEKGFYADAGLTVKQTLPAGPTDVVKFVSTGKAQFGLYYAPDTLMGVGEGAPLLSVAGLMTHAPVGMAMAPGVTRERARGPRRHDGRRRADPVDARLLRDDARGGRCRPRRRQGGGSGLRPRGPAARRQVRLRGGHGVR